VANLGGNTVSVLLGTGTGSFATQKTLATGTEPASLTTGDFNRDGKLDLAIAAYNTSPGIVNIALGNADGTFQTPSSVATCSTPAGAVMGDFNGDGHDDVATTCFGAAKMALMTGNGNAMFTVSEVTVLAMPQGIAIGDFNGDAKPDLAVADFGGNAVTVLLGTGTGSFQAPVSAPGGTAPIAVAVGDFNADGHSDVAAANYQTAGTITIAYGNGAGGFPTSKTLIGGKDPTAIAAGDFNNDGKDDFVVANYQDNTLTVVLGPM
ncbi:MAG TPA: VCBS repeat-containing protein, partial [Kofleriaceae bacterium]|nr:VCBS repeat-containing protein [Kofleriaceae bacterium]